MRFSLNTQHYHSVLLSLESLFITPHTHIPQPCGIIEACNGFPAMSFREELILIQRWMSFTADLHCDNLTLYTQTENRRRGGQKNPCVWKVLHRIKVIYTQHYHTFNTIIHFSYIFHYHTFFIHLKTQFIHTFSPYLLTLMSLQTLFHPRKTKGDLYSRMFMLL